MRFAGFLFAGIVAMLAAGIILITFADDTAAPDVAVRLPASTATPAPPPRTWPDALRERPAGALGPLLISCQDSNGDGLIGPRDGGSLAPGLPDIAADPGEPCDGELSRADYYESDSARDFACDGGNAPIHAYVITGGGTNLLKARDDTSLGLMDTLNLLRARAAEVRIPLKFTISTPAIFGVEMAQTNMERLIAHVVASDLTQSACARAVLIGHSHGGVTVTSVTAAIEDRFPSRMLGVLIDRSIALYDRPADEMPVRTRLLNVFQTNAGWHGVYLDGPNVINFDASSERAPVTTSDGAGGPALVTHRTLDDVPAVQQRIVDEILRWAVEGP
jgi:hypothetical protein